MPNLGAMRAVAERLDRVGLPYAFIGGSIVNLLVDHPELIPAQPTAGADANAVTTPDLNASPKLTS